MSTYEKLNRIAEELREIHRIDTDGPRLCEEYLGELVPTDHLNQKIEDLESKCRELNRDVDRERNRYLELKDKIENLL